MSEEEIIILMKHYAERIAGTGFTSGQVLPMADKITELSVKLRQLNAIAPEDVARRALSLGNQMGMNSALAGRLKDLR